MNSQPLFPWLQQRIPTISQDVNKGFQFPQIDHLYIDCTEILVQLLKNRKFQSLKEFVKALFIQIEEVKNLVSPLRLIFLSFDGTIPVQMQKKIHQRIHDIGKTHKNQISYLDLLPGCEKAIEFEKLVYENIRTLNKKMDEQSLKLRVLYQGINVYGDAQQKINDFIRKQRTQNNYNPNTSHCIYSRQTEAFITGLSSHDLRFYILNNEVIKVQDLESVNYLKGESEQKPTTPDDTMYQLYSIQEFRQCLDFEFQYMERMVNQYNLERIIDDIVLLLITIHHAELIGFRLNRSLDIFIYIYKRIYPFFDGYMTNNGDIDISNFKIFLKVLGQSEQAIIQNFYRLSCFENKQYDKKVDDRWTDLIKKIKEEIQQEYESDSEDDNENKKHDGRGENQTDEQKDMIQKLLVQSMDNQDEQQIENQDQVPKQDQTDQFLYNEQEFFFSPEFQSAQYNTLDQSEHGYYDVLKNSQKYCERYLEGASFYSVVHAESNIEIDNILKNQITGDKNYKTEFYKNNFGVKTEEQSNVTEFLKVMQQQYFYLLHWWHSFYYKGYLSWKWYFKYSHPPFISDIVENIDTLTVTLEAGLPIKPIEQRLMIVDNTQVELVPKLFKFMVEDKEKTEEIGVFMDPMVTIPHWSHEFEQVPTKKMNVDDILAICQNYEEFLQEDEQKLNRKGKSIMIASWESVSSEQSQVRSILNWEQNNLACEIFLLEELNSAYNIYGLLTPFYKETPNCNLLENATQDYEPRYTIEYADSKEIIKMAERSLSSQFERNELFNKGLDKHVPQPVQTTQPPQQNQNPPSQHPQQIPRYPPNRPPYQPPHGQQPPYYPPQNKRPPSYHLTPPPQQQRPNPRFQQY